MIRVGLTGGIGAGKSEVSRLLEGHGAIVIRADELAREVVAPGTPGLDAVVAEFGADLLDEHGALDRDAMASLVFNDPAARMRLEAITHPLVEERMHQLMAAAPDDAVLVYDVPLLVEKDMQQDFDLVVVVDADDDTRLRRLAESRDMSAEDAQARMASQSSREQRLAAADVVISNDGDMEELTAQVAELWEELHDRLA
jgi:dephospho-CoA kinase